ncbi:RNA polymerase factor sigma-32 [Iodidimonas sp. SYSU 1G8]|uniref:RNA polymerase factor sigma-32 n=1 Tax=Iodidimonas sp. SYSU 1G8 TaxID=3133967 RepID=UPI0031FE8BC1
MDLNPQRIDQRLVKAATDARLLGKEEEFDLARRWRDDHDHAALQQLMGAYLRLVISMASKYRHYGLPANDLVQEGCLGLIQAADRFEPERDIRFSTYASWWIRSAIQDYVLRNWSIVRTGTTAAQKKLFFNLRRLRSLIGQSTGNDSAAPISAETRQRIATQLGVKQQEVDYMEARLTGGDQSVNAPVGEEGDNEWQDYIADDRAIPEDAVMTAHDTQIRLGWLKQAMETLTEREKLIIQERRLGEESVTLAVLGDQLGISKERVRQIEHQALGKLRKALLRLVGGDPHRVGLIPST